MLPSTVPNDSLLQGLSAAFINGAEVATDAECRPQLLYNDPASGIKVISVLEDELKHCKSFKISVAFINDAGIAPLLLTLKELEEKGVRGQILTTDYLAFTEPKALRRLLKLSNIELKLFRCRGRDGFHTKGYIFESPEMLHLIVGSSNWTASALATNREWNALLLSKASGLFARQLLAEFDALWNRPESLTLTEADVAQYELQWRAARRSFAHSLPSAPPEPPEKLAPNSMQQGFIQNLEALRKAGARRALLISATGTGKTYAAAFATQAMAPKRFLFLVHRAQIADQALKSFQRVLGTDRTYGLLSGLQKSTTEECLFATMQTMSKADVLSQFDPKAFDLIIIDEVHRAGASSYQKIMEHFQPDFWLGMTASPDRTDGYDIYKLFDHNIACEIRLQTALAEDLLCPFHYFGIADLTVDGDKRPQANGFNSLASDERVKHLLDRLQYFGYSGDRVKGLIFCSSVAECTALSAAFNETGLRTVALSGADSQAQRAAAVERLVQDEGDEALDYLFSVDIFNEGVDIPEVNQVVLLRPTESAIVFVQQLGRGLRKAAGKDYVVVLDFIGNYDENFLIPVALSGDLSYDKDRLRRYVAVDHRQTPGLSTVHFDEITTERICRAIDTANTQSMRLLKGAYQTLKYKLGRRPKLEDFEAHNSIDAVTFFTKCGSYYTFLKRYDKDFTDRLPPEAEQIIDFMSTRFGRGLRLSDAVMLDSLLDNEHCLLDHLKKELATAYGCSASEINVGNVIDVFSNQFFRGAGPTVPLLESNQDGDWRTATAFSSLLCQHPLLERFLRDLTNFMKLRWRKRHSQRYQNTDFTLYGKYSYQDVCRLLNWARDETATIGGYRFDEKTKTHPVFINYQKTVNAVQYADRFESPQDLMAHSKTQRSPQSVDADHIYKRKPEDRENRLFLFVRRNKKGAPTFYFLGEIEAVGKPKPVPLNGKPAFEIHYRLKTPVRQDLYDYITKTTL